MSLTSNLFILFVFITVVLYYILPHKIQWLVLLRQVTFIIFIRDRAMCTLSYFPRCAVICADG